MTSSNDSGTAEEQPSAVYTLYGKKLTKLREAYEYDVFDIDGKVIPVFDGDITEMLVLERLKAKRELWQRINGRDGLYLNPEGCVEIHLDYVEECIAELDKQIKEQEK